jgi:hypothetical protein
MLYRINRLLMAGIVTLGLGASGLRAAEATKAPPAKAVEAKVVAPKPATENQVKPAGTAIDINRLGQILEDMGYDAKKVGDTTYDVVLKRDGWTIYLRLSFSTDGSRLWVVSSLADIEDASKIPNQVLVDLLEATQAHSPSSFYLYNPKDAKKPAFRYLKIARPVDNRGINSRTLRAEIDTLFTSIRDTKALWMPSEWTKTKPAAPATTVSADKKEAKVTK